MDQCKPIINDSTLPIFTQITCSNLDTIAISQQSILDIIKSLNVNKAHGPDNISGRMIQLCGDKITLPLSIIFVNIINTGIFPTLWKSGNITSIHKKDSKRVINNYRPISLLPLFAKIFEKTLFLEIYNHLTSNNLITKNQSGFRPNDSVINQLICLVDSIHSSLDITWTFVSSFSICQKPLTKCGMEDYFLNLNKMELMANYSTFLKVSYLANRNQRVLLNGSES